MAWFGRSRSDSTPAPPAGDQGNSPAALRDALTAVVATINSHAGSMPTRAVVNARHLTDTLGEIVETSEVRPLDMYAVLTLRSTMEDYLPTTINRYLAVDEDHRERPLGTGLSAAQSLLQQIEVLQTSASATLAAVRQQDEQALMIQGSFLETRFSRSDLDF